MPEPPEIEKLGIRIKLWVLDGIWGYSSYRVRMIRLVYVSNLRIIIKYNNYSYTMCWVGSGGNRNSVVEVDAVVSDSDAVDTKFRYNLWYFEIGVI